ncbi:hypothetical protein [Streptomyces ipomoeae]|uniref:hypothetical protein n=1 Tax=Streptomyces ipomoeae TaxID=103232 RepID=UPI0011468662|nr:hypothetical protein [Streptomyces ipomoeae]TQE33060.1 hypothetical protein Sipo7851_21390 [Streptomyces ipomoeae]
MSTPNRPHGEEIHQLTTRAITDATGAWDALVAAQQEVTRALAAARRRRRRARSVPLKVRSALRDFTEAIARFSTATRALAERWTAVDLPRIYRLGAEEALRRAAVADRQARPGFAWHDEHQRVIKTVTSSLYALLIQRFTDVVRRAQAFARAATATAREADPPPAAALAEEHPLDTVVYARAIRHPAASWARSAFGAQSITAANAGALAAARADLGAHWVQVTDGPECGWTSHTDVDQAHNTLRSATQAAAHPIAHPGCLRMFIPRPDLNDRPDLEEGQPL